MNRFVATILLSTPQLLLGGGFHISVHDAYAAARGNAVAATIGRPSSVYYNPAGLSRIDEIAVSGGVYAVDFNVGASVSSGNFQTQTDLQYLPHLYISYPLMENLTAGFGLTVPFGLSTVWEDAPLTFFATENKIADLNYSFALGYKVNDKLRIGGTLDFHDIHAEFGSRPPLEAFGGLPTNVEIEGDDLSIGFSLGIQCEINKQHQVGLVYRHTPEFDLEGYQNISGMPGQSINVSDVKLPDTAAFSYNYTPTEQWNLGIGIEWINWDSLNSYQTSGGAIELPVSFDWDTGFMYEFGCSYHTKNNWILSAGYVYNQNAQPDNADYNPSVSDADRHWLSAGLGQEFEHLDWHVAYQYGFSDRNINSASPLIRGDYETDSHTLMFTATYKL